MSDRTPHHHRRPLHHTYSTPFPSCFRPKAIPRITAGAATEPPPAPSPPPPPPPPPQGAGSPNLTTCLYHTDFGIFALTWSRNLLGRSLHLDLRFDAEDDSQSPPATAGSFHLQIKPFFFWTKHGSRKLAVDHCGSRNVRVFWDLTRAKYGSGPEPQSGFFVAVVVEGEMTLLVGDRRREAYAKTRARKAERTQVLLLRREHLFGNKIYTTKARFGGRNREISIDCSLGEDSRLSFSVDRKKVLQIKRLKWKFRGNERIEVDGVPIQFSWDVYNWAFEDGADGHAVFMFRFEKQGLEEDEYVESRNDLSEKISDGVGELFGGFGMNGFERKKMKKSLMRSGRSSSSSSLSSASSGCSSSVMEWASMEEKQLKGPSGFSLLVYAWKS
ncbi:uncharacterized protein LOC131151954 [Malania oleifera]|uniref:uncharacterized protein LOC131151954 n=1 Tax=Malania oleifera TaxID=397392 RepID=UPI0025ADF935|nr:uncharacterized protein LOC131151954 [Malania oleifera]